MSFSFPLWAMLSLLETALPLAGTIAHKLSNHTNEVIPIGGMLANNRFIAINLAYQNLDCALYKMMNIESKLSLAATPKLASKGAIRESIRLATARRIDSVNIWLLIPCMMTGLIGGVPPLQAIKFQLLVVFIHTDAHHYVCFDCDIFKLWSIFQCKTSISSNDVKSES